MSENLDCVHPLWCSYPELHRAGITAQTEIRVTPLYVNTEDAFRAAFRALALHMQGDPELVSDEDMRLIRRAGKILGCEDDEGWIYGE
jgi:hypothetical protein